MQVCMQEHILHGKACPWRRLHDNVFLHLPWWLCNDPRLWFLPFPEWKPAWLCKLVSLVTYNVSQLARRTPRQIDDSAHCLLHATSAEAILTIIVCWNTVKSVETRQICAQSPKGCFKRRSELRDPTISHQRHISPGGKVRIVACFLQFTSRYLETRIESGSGFSMSPVRLKMTRRCFYQSAAADGNESWMAIWWRRSWWHNIRVSTLARSRCLEALLVIHQSGWGNLSCNCQIQTSPECALLCTSRTNVCTISKQPKKVTFLTQNLSHTCNWLSDHLNRHGYGQ